MKSVKNNRRPAPPTRSREIAIVSAEGEVDRAGIEACDYMITRAGEGLAGVVVDLTQATHVDYRGVVVLVARRRVLKARGGELAVAAHRREVRDIVRSEAGLELPVFATLEEARSWVRGDAAVEAIVPGARSAARLR